MAGTQRRAEGAITPSGMARTWSCNLRKSGGQGPMDNYVNRSCSPCHPERGARSGWAPCHPERRARSARYFVILSAGGASRRSRRTSRVANARSDEGISGLEDTRRMAETQRRAEGAIAASPSIRLRAGDSLKSGSQGSMGRCAHRPSCLWFVHLRVRLTKPPQIAGAQRVGVTLRPWLAYGSRPPRLAAIGAGFARLAAGCSCVRPAGASQVAGCGGVPAAGRRPLAAARAALGQKSRFAKGEKRRGTPSWSKIPFCEGWETDVGGLPDAAAGKIPVRGSRPRGRNG